MSSDKNLRYSNSFQRAIFESDKLGISYQSDLDAEESNELLKEFEVSTIEHMQYEKIQRNDLSGQPRIHTINDCIGISDWICFGLYQEGIKAYYTIGSVFVNNEPYIETSLEYLSSEYRNPSSGVLNLHCWLTLEDGRIIDPTILVKLAFREEFLNGHFAEGLVYFEKPDLIEEIEFKPILVGSDYIVKVGAMNPFGVRHQNQSLSTALY